MNINFGKRWDRIEGGQPGAINLCQVLSKALLALDPQGSGGGCVFVGALLHYLTLTTMMWMAVEARNMYVSTVKVFPEDATRYMLKASLFAWGEFRFCRAGPLT